MSSCLQFRHSFASFVVNLFVQRLQVHAVAMMSTSAVEAVAMMLPLGIRVIEGASMMSTFRNQENEGRQARSLADIAEQAGSRVALLCFVCFVLCRVASQSTGDD